MARSDLADHRLASGPIADQLQDVRRVVGQHPGGLVGHLDDRRLEHRLDQLEPGQASVDTRTVGRLATASCGANASTAAGLTRSARVWSPPPRSRARRSRRSSMRRRSAPRSALCGLPAPWCRRVAGHPARRCVRAMHRDGPASPAARPRQEPGRRRATARQMPAPPIGAPRRAAVGRVWSSSGRCAGPRSVQTGRFPGAGPASDVR